MNNTIEAVRLLGTFTAGSFDTWRLAGPHNAGRRALVLSTLRGKKTPQSQAGVTAIRAAMYDALKIPAAGCEHEREELMYATAVALLAGPS
jgi:hypothetical protein